MRLGTAAAAFAAVVSVGACGGGSSREELPQAPRHCTDVPPRRTVDAAIEIGNGSAEDFLPYTMGGSELLVLGFQGGYMLTPTLRIDSDRLGTDGECVFLDWTATVDGQAPLIAHFKLPDAIESGRYWEFPMLPLFLSRDLSVLLERSCSIVVTFADDEVSTSTSVAVKLTH